MVPNVLISNAELPALSKQIARELMASLKAKQIRAVNIDTIFAAIDEKWDVTTLTSRRRDTLADLVVREVITLAGK